MLKGDVSKCMKRSWKERQNVVIIESHQKRIITAHVCGKSAPPRRLPWVRLSPEPGFWCHSMKTTCPLSF